MHDHLLRHDGQRRAGRSGYHAGRRLPARDSISPVDWDAIDASVRKTKRVFVFEETSDRECLADEIFAHLIETGIPAVCRKRNLGRGFIPHGAPAALLAAAGLDADSLTKLMQEELS